MSNIIEKTKIFATDLLTNSLDPKHLYHNLRHTERVVKSTKELLEAHTLSDEDKEALLLTAWLHDVGYIKGTANHEESSCIIGAEFLSKQGYDEKKIQKVTDYIKATKRYHEPKTLQGKIIRDADCSHFAQKSFFETSDYLREELSLLEIAEYTAKEWRNANIEMFEKEQHFYTDYAIENWSKGKAKNLKKLIKADKTEKEIAKKEAIKAKYKNESPDRGIQTLFRVTLKNHLTLSDIADTKANILLSVNAIIISVALSSLLPKLDNPSNAYLIYPSVIFITFSVVSMIMAVLATRPNVTSGKFTKEDVKNKKVNLLFFGNFHKMTLEEYEWAIQELVKDKEYIYASLTKDLYFLGLVLDRKYKILRWTYTIFMIGIIISVLAFGISFRLFGSGRTADIVTALF
jgi:predicted metal-dependent HD superfamily phosphohydrolase